MTLRRRVLGSVGCSSDGHLLGSGRVQNDNVAVQLQHAHAPGGRRHLHAAVTNFAGCTSTDKPACFSTLYARLSGHLPAPLPSLWNDRLHIPVAHGEAAHGPGRVAGIQGLVRVVELTTVVAEDARVLERADGGLDLEVACALPLRPSASRAWAATCISWNSRASMCLSMFSQTSCQANQAVDFDCPLQQVLSNARATSASMLGKIN